jgi:hypothetical protein
MSLACRDGRKPFGAPRERQACFSNATDRTVVKRGLNPLALSADIAHGDADDRDASGIIAACPVDLMKMRIHFG